MRCIGKTINNEVDTNICHSLNLQDKVERHIRVEIGNLVYDIVWRNTNGIKNSLKSILLEDLYGGSNS